MYMTHKRRLLAGILLSAALLSGCTSKPPAPEGSGSAGAGDLYAMDGVSEEDTAVDTKPLHEDDVNPEKAKEEDSVNSSIHL